MNAGCGYCAVAQRCLYPFHSCPLLCIFEYYNDWFIFHDVEDNRNSANFTSAQIFQIDRLVQLAVGFPRIDIAFVSHSLQSADLIGMLQMYVKMKYIKLAALSIRC